MKIKFVQLIGFVFLSFLKLYSQDYKYIYYFDKDLLSCNKSESVITGKGVKENGLFRLDYFSNENGEILLSVHFTDSSLSMMQGYFKAYYSGGKVAQSGEYIQEQKQGLWQQWDEEGFKTDSVIYDHDNRVQFAKFDYYKKDKSRRSYSCTDSIADTFTELYYYRKDRVSSEVFFIGQRGWLKIYDTTGVITRTDSVFSRENEEAYFIGGEPAWRSFLVNNINVQVPVNNRASAGEYTVMVKFIIEKDGTVSNISAETYPGYGTEAEAIRVIKKSPKWMPAKQYGQLIRAYRRQPIIFYVE